MVLFRTVAPLKWLRVCSTGPQDLRLLGKATLTVHPGVPEILDVSGPGAYLSPSLQPLSVYLPLRLPSGKPRLDKNGRGTRPQRAELLHRWAQMAFQVARKMPGFFIGSHGKTTEGRYLLGVGAHTGFVKGT